MVQVVAGRLLQDRFFAEVVPDHLRHPQEDELVIGGAGAHPVDQDDLALQVGFGKAGEEYFQVLDPAVDEVNDHVTVNIPGVYPAIGADIEVRTFYQGDAQQVGQVAVLEEGGPELAVGQDNAGGGLVVAQGREEVEIGVPYVVADDVIGLGQLRHDALGDFHALELVGNPRRYTQVVLEDGVLPVSDVDEVNAVDMDEDVPGREEVLVLRIVVLAGEDHVVGNDGLGARV